MFGWGTGELNFPPAPKLSREEQEELNKKKEAMEKIERDGFGICQFCNEEIAKNRDMPGGGWTWESEILLGYCPNGKQGKHVPLVRYVPNEGVVNVESDSESI